jgi:hypothetical protein
VIIGPHNSMTSALDFPLEVTILGGCGELAKNQESINKTWTKHTEYVGQ